MSQATQLPFPSFSEEEKIELPNEPRLLFIRVSLDIAMHQDVELRRLVNSTDPIDACQAMAILQAEANGVPEKELICPLWGHQNASHHLLRTEATDDAFSYSEEDLYISAVFCAAELQVSRKAEMHELELHIFNLVTSANKLITGWWKGKQLGLISFWATAARHHGALFAPNGVSHKAWGLEPKAKLEDLVRAVRDVNEFPSSLHLAAWKLGAWPVLSLARAWAGSSIICSDSAALPQKDARSTIMRRRAPRRRRWEKLRNASSKMSNLRKQG